MKVETILIEDKEHPYGKKLINKSDFDAKTMVEWSDKPQKAPRKKKGE